MSDKKEYDKKQDIVASILSALNDTAALQTPDIPDDVYWINLSYAVYNKLKDEGLINK